MKTKLLLIAGLMASTFAVAQDADTVKAAEQAQQSNIKHKVINEHRPQILQTEIEAGDVSEAKGAIFIEGDDGSIQYTR